MAWQRNEMRKGRDGEREREDWMTYGSDGDDREKTKVNI